MGPCVAMNTLCSLDQIPSGARIVAAFPLDIAGKQVKRVELSGEGCRGGLSQILGTRIVTQHIIRLRGTPSHGRAGMIVERKVKRRRWFEYRLQEPAGGA